METIKYEVEKYILKKSTNIYDIVIKNPKFSSIYLDNVKFSLIDPTNDSELQILDDHIFSLYSNACLYKNILVSNKDLFICSEIPFNYVSLTNLYFVIHNVNKVLIEKIMKCILTFSYNTINNTKLNSRYEMKWNSGIYNNSSTAKLVFSEGCVSMSYYNSIINEKYIDINNNICINSIDTNYEKCLCFNLNHLDTNNNYIIDSDKEFDLYSNYKLINMMYLINSPFDNVKFNVLSETYKIPTQKFNLIDNSYLCKFELSNNCIDGITNINLLCDNKKYNVLTARLYKYDFLNKCKKYTLKLEKTKEGYKILNYNNFIIMPLIYSSHIDIEITLEKSNELNSYIDNFDIKLDRIILYDEIKEELIQNYKYLIINYNVLNINNLLKLIENNRKKQNEDNFINFIFKNEFDNKVINPENKVTNSENKVTNLEPQIKKQKTNKVNINMPVNTIDDLLNIINSYPDDELTEYNINISILHKIKDPLIELNRIIGMKKLKNDLVSQIIYYLQGINNDSNDYMHIVIYGSPGTGKTEVAKIIGLIFSKMGILKKETFKKVTRPDLIAEYVGQTAIKTKKVINESLGGVLFIDEAYSLGNDDTYSKECIDTLCEALSDNKSNWMVIIAGYENELEKYFFDMNSGLNSRFTWRYKVDEYTSSDLYDIFLKKIADNKWSILTDTNINVKWFEKNKDKFKFYGRDIETLFAKTKIAHSKRVFCLDQEVKKKITLEDLNNGLELFLNNCKSNQTVFTSGFLSMYT